MADELSAVAEPLEQKPAPEPTAEETAQSLDNEGESQETAEQTPAEEVTGDGRTLPNAIKALKGVNPEAYEAAKRAFFAEKDYSQQFPGGVKEARELMQFLTEQGGREGIQQIVTEVADYRQLSEAMQKGDVPAVLDRMTPEFIAQSAPEYLSRFYEAAPEQCNAMLCGVVSKSLNDSVIPQSLYEATMALRYLERVPGAAQDPSFAEMKAAIEKITGAVQGFSTTASKPVQSQQRPQQGQDREAQFADRERQQTETHYLQRMTTDLEPKIAAEAKTLGYDLTERQLKLLYFEATKAMDYAVGQAGRDLIKGHLQKNDVNKAVQTAQSRYGQVLAEVVKKEAGELFRMPTKPKTATPPPTTAAKPAQKPQVANKPASAFAERFQKAFA